MQMKSKYRIGINMDSLHEVLIDYLVSHYELTYSFDQSVRRMEDKEYRKRQMKENRKTMKALEETILYFTAPDDSRRDLRNRF